MIIKDHFNDHKGISKAKLTIVLCINEFNSALSVQSNHDLLCLFSEG